MYKQNKYHNKVVYADGERFDSKKEYQRWKELQILERARKISNLQRQVRFILIETQTKKGEKTRPRTCYVADFVYRENGELVVEDTKGYKTDLYKLKAKIMYEKYGIWIRET